jgi:hypothetical protein
MEPGDGIKISLKLNRQTENGGHKVIQTMSQWKQKLKTGKTLWKEGQNERVSLSYYWPGVVFRDDSAGGHG